MLEHPADRAPIAELLSVSTSGLDPDTSTWGSALMNLGANFPQTYEGPGVLVMLAGAAEVSNEIDPSRVMRIGEPLSTVALEDTTRYKHPGIIPEPVGELAADELILVDAYDNTGEWLRVVTDGAISWAESDKLARLIAMESLPRIGLGETFPLQAFSLTTGTAYPACDEAEPFVAVQTPEDLSVNLTVNGVDIHIGSMVTFQQVHRNALSLTVHRGEVTTIFGGSVRAGESVLGILGATGDRAVEVLDWSGALRASESEVARGQRAQDMLNSVARVNGWPEYTTSSMPPDLVHVVVYGDTLYAIARHYEASVAEIIAANQTGDPLRLFAGIKLIIPNPGSGFAGQKPAPAPAVAPAAADNESGSASDCGGLRLTSPLVSAPGSLTPFYWNGVPGATQYQVNIYDHSSNAQVGSVMTAGGESSISIAIGQFGVGGQFRWEVHALANGQVICSSGLSQPLIHAAS